MNEIRIKNLEKPTYQVSEALNTLCANLSIAGGDIRKILLTSCRPKEGKSFVAMHLFQALSSLGKRIILVDADIRASALRGAYGIEVHTDGAEYQGLSGYLSGLCEINDIVCTTGIAGADMILSGKAVLNSFPLFNSVRLEQLLKHLKEQYDVVLIDAPPVGTIIDAAKIAVHCDGVVMIVESNAIPAGELIEAAAQIQKTGCPILGYILNKVHQGDYKQKYYTYYSSGNGDKKNNTGRTFLGKILRIKRSDHV